MYAAVANGELEVVWMSGERVLVVEDNRDLASLIYESMEDAGFEPDHAADGLEALRLMREASPPFDAVVLDIGLPRLNGLEVCSRLRSEGYGAPIVMLTAQGCAEDIVRGLDGGSDDYVVKPFEMRVLIARVRAAIRRYLSMPDHAGVIHTPLLTLDTTSNFVRLATGIEVDVSPLQTRLLAMLVRHAPRVVTRDELERALWRDSECPSPDALRAHIYQLRQLLDKAGAGNLVRTRGKLGYYLEVPPCS